MIYLQLFLNFLKIGTVSFGGGYGMISLIRETVLYHNWMSEEEFMAFIALSESTPGPLAVNMATLIGASQGGMAGAFFATLGVVSPAFFIILIIAALINNLLKYAGVRAFLDAIRPCVAGLILATAITMALSTFCSIKHIDDAFVPDSGSICIFIILSAIGICAGKLKHKTPSPIIMILLSAVLGIIFSL